MAGSGEETVKAWLPLIIAAICLLLSQGQWIATVVDPQPTPTPDVVPEPTPVDPVDPIPLPEPITGTRILFVFESTDNIPVAQQHVVYSAAVQAWLAENCAQVDGHAQWHCWDKDTDATRESETWQAIWKYTLPKLGPLPCVLIVRDQAGKIHDLPATEAELLRLLKGGV
jgi:hypothetical protein